MGNDFQDRLASARRVSNAGFVLLWLLIVVVSAVLTPRDQAWTTWLARNKAEGFAEWMSQSLFERESFGGSDGPVIVFFGVLFCYLAGECRGWRGRRQRRLGYVAVSGLTSAVMLVYSVKQVIGRARPGLVFAGEAPYTDWFEFGPHYFSTLNQAGFPSGHASCVSLLIPMAYALAGLGTSWPRRLAGWGLGALAVGYTLSMAVGRAMTQSHWLTDGILAMLFSWLIAHTGYRLLYLERARALEAETGPETPPFWEARLCGWLAVMATGFWWLGMGVRGGFWPALAWPAVLVPAGGGLLIWGWKRLRRCYALGMRVMADGA